jgi:glyoxylase-like metal-dependent hydrolase (beta-lactamase superfamily II)
MTHAEYLTAHALAGEHSGYEPAATGALFRRHGMAAEHLAALNGRGNTYKRGVPELPTSFDRLLAGDHVRFGGVDWRVIEGHGHSPEHASLYASEQGHPDFGRYAAAEDQHQRQRAGQVEPDGDPLARFLDSLIAFETLPVDTLVLPSHGLPFRGIALRVAQLRAHHVARLDELDAATDGCRRRGCSAADLVPVLFRRELDLQQRYFAMGEAIAHLNYLWRAKRLDRRVATDGTIRFLRFRRSNARPLLIVSTSEESHCHVVRINIELARRRKAALRSRGACRVAYLRCRQERQAACRVLHASDGIGQIHDDRRIRHRQGVPGIDHQDDGQSLPSSPKRRWRCGSTT